ncbi:dihydropteroate synthase [Campylobacter sp. 19-13652]|uniref:dihydropteroate synthase n=1 Tax=Campylobacter sp. 19-13652 TaxID=2840180 RepID=UPI001C798073|nr:dihydropteroate synthase [Campylobacter sp. 19-13652]BCX79661.1 dihydropteroate synthase [Campylobacter sp. 19-13652]
MKIYEINPKSDFDKLAGYIGASAAGAIIMHKKSEIKFILLKDIKAAAANILKQDALSVGADLLTHKDTILGGRDKFQAVLMATPAQLKILAKKESAQDFSLKELAKFLSASSYEPSGVSIMGVVNINEDSFNPASRKSGVAAIEKIEQMIKAGASYVDIGAVSSRPGSEYIGAEAEFARLKWLLDEIYRLKIYENVRLSLDSFDEHCLEYALDRGFSFINDISANENLAFLAAKYDVPLCIMHMQGNPKNMQDSPHYDDLLGEISDFFTAKIAAAKDRGAKKIVLDVGIGFGKTAEHNMLLIKHLSHFNRLGYPLLVGASRKSVINAFYKSDVKDRLAGSLFLHLMAAQNGAEIIRTHDVAEHAQLFALNDAYNDINLW